MCGTQTGEWATASVVGGKNISFKVQTRLNVLILNYKMIKGLTLIGSLDTFYCCSLNSNNFCFSSLSIFTLHCFSNSTFQRVIFGTFA